MKLPAVSIPLGGFNRSGGVQTLVVLANAMAASGWRVRILAPDYAAQSPVELSPAVLVERIATWRLPAAVRRAVYYARLGFRAARGSDLCLANYYPTVYCALASKLWNRQAQVIYFIQGDEAVSHGLLAQAGRLSRRLRAWLARGSYRLPVKVICVSYWLKQRTGRPDAAVVTQGLDLNVFHPVSRSWSRGAPVVIGTVGSPAEGKGYKHFCRAVELIADQPVEIVVASPEPVPLPVGVKALQVSPGNEKQMADFYRRCDVFVFASLSEGFGLPPLEAMACGCAVVTTDCGGVTDFAKDGVNCLMVPRADAAAMAEAITRLLQDRNLPQRLAEEGSRTARQFDRARMVSQFLQELAA